MPFTVSGKARDGLGGTRHVRAVDNGWLVGFDAAEVGGALWWFDKTGERRVKLFDGNIIGFVELAGEGIVALSGFARGGFSRGQALRVRRAVEWTAKPWINLDSAAEAFVLESRDSLLVLTTTGVVRLTACGDMTRVALTDYDALYPTSLAVDPHGVIYVGMRHYITRFVPALGSALREEWLTREDCQTPKVSHFECVCTGFDPRLERERTHDTDDDGDRHLPADDARRLSRARGAPDPQRTRVMVAQTLSVVMSSAGLYLPAVDLHLDPSIGVQAAFVSHAHSARVGSLTSGLVLGSPETLRLIEMRAEAPPASRAIDWNESIERPLSAGFGGGTARLSIAHAGHLLGAAQLVIDHPGGRFVYTGDYQSGPGLTHVAGAPVPCDELVIESTYALPIFRFPDRARVRLALVEWCRARLGEGNAPVVIAIPLGNSQEIVRALVDADLTVQAHDAVYRGCEMYESLGVALGLAEKKVRPYVKKKGPADAVLIAPPSAYADAMIKKLPNARVAYVSGRALLDASLEQMRADIGFPLSGHADHDDLVATARACGARHVVTTFGDATSFAGILNERGLAATALEASSLDETT